MALPHPRAPCIAAPRMHPTPAEGAPRPACPAVLVTDGSLEEEVEGPEITIHQPEEVLQVTGRWAGRWTAERLRAAHQRAACSGIEVAWHRAHACVSQDLSYRPAEHERVVCGAARQERAHAGAPLAVRGTRCANSCPTMGHDVTQLQCGHGARHPGLVSKLLTPSPPGIRCRHAGTAQSH